MFSNALISSTTRDFEVKRRGEETTISLDDESIGLSAEAGIMTSRESSSYNRCCELRRGIQQSI